MDRSELLNAIADLVAFAVRTGVEVERERCAKIAEQNSEVSIAAAIRAQPTE